LRIGIFAKFTRCDYKDEMSGILTWLQDRGNECLVDERIVQSFSMSGVKGMPASQIPEKAEMAFVFGGDGSMLSTARTIGSSYCPILGINLGSLGFLTEVPAEQVYKAMEAVLDGRYELEERCLLKARLFNREGREFVYYALNEIVVSRAALSRVITVDTCLDDDFIAEFVADGVMIATPTGSTAYSLSAGGPIVHPAMEAFLVTPICPHTLTNRPLIVPADRSLRITLRSGEDVKLSIDGQVGVDFFPGEEVVCEQAPFKIHLIRSGGQGFFDVLRHKLKWSERYTNSEE
jgi:NAD+ kinase